MAKQEKTSRTYVKKSGVSTREAIIDKAREIINNGGVIDFRIEALAVSLGLSPGNITYHFPRKEDIVHAIWAQSRAQVDEQLELMNTPLLDIKQLFLIYRSSAMKSLDYLGVKSFFNGDIGNLNRESESNREYIDVLRKYFYKSYKILRRNGYIKDISNPVLEELLFQTQFIILRWWYNQAMLGCDINKVKSDIDHYIIRSLYPLMPYYTESGREQFENIKMMIKQN